MKIPFNKVELSENVCSLNDKGYWYVTSLIQKIKELNLEIFDFPLHCIDLNTYIWGKKLSMYEIITHLRQVNVCDLEFPIIISEEGTILDGWHRIIKAIIENKKTVKAVRFEKKPAIRYIKLIL